jgi:hypothetical protein
MKRGRYAMSLLISSGGIAPISPVEELYDTPLQAPKAVAPPPPPPPPPPPKDVVQLSLAANVQKLKFEGDSPTEISIALGVPLQTVSVVLDTSVIEATLASAPTLPTPTGH